MGYIVWKGRSKTVSLPGDWFILVIFGLFIDEIAKSFEFQTIDSNWEMIGDSLELRVGCSKWINMVELDRKQTIESQIEYTLSDGIIRHTHRFGFCEGNRRSICHLACLHHLPISQIDN